MFLELAIVAGVRLSPTKVTLLGGFRGICGKIKTLHCYMLHCYMLHVTIRWFHMSRMLLAKRGYGAMGCRKAIHKNNVTIKKGRNAWDICVFLVT